MKVAVVQYDPVYLETANNLDTVASLIDAVEADLFVLPELFASGYFFRSTEDVQDVAELVPEGRTTQRLRAWAREKRAVFVAGVPERDGEVLYNAAVLVRPDGSTETYRKVHLYNEERLHFAIGNLGFPVFDVADRQGETYRIGLMVCYDWYYPEAARSLALGGADIIAHPSNLVRPDCPRAMPIRALENHLFTVTANRTGHEQKGRDVLTFIGQSQVCDPAGTVMHRMGRDESGVLIVEVEPRAARDRQITVHNDLLADRVPEAYNL